MKRELSLKLRTPQRKHAPSGEVPEIGSVHEELISAEPASEEVAGERENAAGGGETGVTGATTTAGEFAGNQAQAGRSSADGNGGPAVKGAEELIFVTGQAGETGETGVTAVTGQPGVTGATTSPTPAGETGRGAAPVHSRREQPASGGPGLTGATSTGGNGAAAVAARASDEGRTVSAEVVAAAALDGEVKGRTKQVWEYLLGVSQATEPPTYVFRQTRREIQLGAKIGSRNTVDAALERLQGLGRIRIQYSPGVNEGSLIEICRHEQAPLEESPAAMADLFRRTAEAIETGRIKSSPEMLNRLGRIAGQVTRLVPQVQEA